MNPRVDHDYASTLYLDTWIPLIYDSGDPLDINQPPPYNYCTGLLCTATTVNFEDIDNPMETR